ncbi:hypothetical protein DFJ74DRAFT_708804 [Hyaloraphidium curvatum]|nr:hypothetical protein DFJ74DRAFT_708804 [Hyaloraphidium curvatum]
MAGTGYLENDLMDLKQRFDLLDSDRRAYYGTSQWAMRQNKEEMEALEARNKALREAVARLKREEPARAAPSQASDAEGAARLDLQLRDLAKRHDELQNELRVKEGIRKRCHDEVEAVEREVEQARRHREESDQAKAGGGPRRDLQDMLTFLPGQIQELRSLESRLDTTTTKYNEALAVRRTYDAILQALQAERLSFDGRLVEFEKNLKQKRKEVEELEGLGREAEKGKEAAWLELQELEAKVTEERAARQSALQDQRDQVQRGHDENQVLESQLLKAEAEEASLASAAASRSALGRSEGGAAEDAALQAQLAAAEEGIRAFKEATGCADISEVAAKFRAQRETVDRLSRAMADGEAAVASLKSELASVSRELDRAKFAAASPADPAQPAGARVGELEAMLQAARRQRDEVRNEYLEADSFLETVMDGVQYLHDRLHGTASKPETVDAQVTRHNLAQKLSQCSDKIARIHEQSIFGSARGSLLLFPAPPPAKPPTQAEPAPAPATRDDSDSEDTLFGDRDAVKRRWEELAEAQKGAGPGGGAGAGGFSIAAALAHGPRLRE